MNGSVVKFKQSADFMTDDELKARWQESDRKDIIRARLLQEARNRGRTQDEIAQVVGVSNVQVSRLLTFADFITWTENLPAGNNPEFALYRVTEYKFRGFWSKRKDLLGKTRHRAVLEDLIDHQKEQDRHDNTRYLELVNAFKENGLVSSRKYKVSTLAEKTGFTKEFVLDYLTGSHRRNKPSHGIQIEQVGSKTYKLHHTSGKKVDPAVILGEIRDLLDELEKYGKMPVGSHKIVPAELLRIAYLIEKRLKDL